MKGRDQREGRDLRKGRDHREGRGHRKGRNRCSGVIWKMQTPLSPSYLSLLSLLLFSPSFFLLSFSLSLSFSFSFSLSLSLSLSLLACYGPCCVDYTHGEDVKGPNTGACRGPTQGPIAASASGRLTGGRE